MLLSPAESQTARLFQFSVHVPICLSFIHFLTILVWFIPGTMMDMAWGLICEGRNVPFFVLGDNIRNGLMVYAPLYEGAFVYKYAFYASYNQGSARKQVSDLFIKKRKISQDSSYSITCRAPGPPAQ